MSIEGDRFARIGITTVGTANDLGEGADSVLIVTSSASAGGPPLEDGELP